MIRLGEQGEQVFLGLSSRPPTSMVSSQAFRNLSSSIALHPLQSVFIRLYCTAWNFEFHAMFLTCVNSQSIELDKGKATSGSWTNNGNSREHRIFFPFQLLSLRPLMPSSGLRLTFHIDQISTFEQTVPLKTKRCSSSSKASLVAFARVALTHVCRRGDVIFINIFRYATLSLVQPAISTWEFSSYRQQQLLTVLW